MEKFTLEVELEKDSEAWEWIFKSLLSAVPERGIRVSGCRREWVGEETNDLLMRASNQLVTLEKSYD